MKLQEIFEQLSAGEFSQLSIGGAEAGVIDATNYSKVLGHVNLGLTALFTRFNLKERRLTFPLQSDFDTYQLDLADMLKITKITTADDFELPLNREGDPYSVLTPALNMLRVPQCIVDQGNDLPEELKTDTLTVVYRANHRKLVLTLGVLTPSTEEVDLPSSHLLPLLYFVASRVHNPIGMSNEFHAGNSYYAKYEAACQALETQGVQVDRSNYNSRLYRGGWV